MQRYGFNVLSLAFLLIFLTSCAVPTPTPAPSPEPVRVVETPTTASRGPVKIILWHSEPEGSPGNTLLGEMARRFHEENPLIIVRPVYAGGNEDLYKKSLAALHAGTPPDLAIIQNSDIAELAAGEDIIDLAPYIEDPTIGLTAEDKADILPGVWEASRFPEFGGQRLSFPFEQSAVALYYNRTVLEVIGKGAPPATWAEFEGACQAIGQGDVKGYAYEERASAFTAWLYSRGGRLLNEEQTRATFNGPEGLDSLELVRRLVDTGCAWRPEGRHAARAAFAAGQAMFTFDETSDAAAYAEAINLAGSGLEWGCTIIPQANPAQPRTALHGAGLCVFKTSAARQEAAWMFIRWITRTEQTAEWAAATGYLPLRKSAIARLAAAGQPAGSEVAAEIYSQVAPYAYPEPAARNMAAVNRAVEDAWIAAANRIKEPQQALDEAAGRASLALAARR